MLTWKHDSDGETCTPVTMSTGAWLCTAHGEPVQWTPHVGGAGNTLDTEHSWSEYFGWPKPASVSDLVREAYAPTVKRMTDEVEAAERDQREYDALLEVQTDEDGDSNAVLRQVGWFCAGGHALPTDMHSGAAVDEPAPADLQMANPCEHAVPVFVLAKPRRRRYELRFIKNEELDVDLYPSQEKVVADTIDRATSPDWDWVKTLIGQAVVLERNDKAQVRGELRLVTDTDVWVVAAGGCAFMIPRALVRSLEPAVWS